MALTATTEAAHTAALNRPQYVIRGWLMGSDIAKRKMFSAKSLYGGYLQNKIG